MERRYLFILEVSPLEAGKTYDELPSHLTLMSRFFSELPPGQLSETVHPLFNKTKPVTLLFDEMTTLGPKKLSVHMVSHSDELKQVHTELRTVLDSLNVVYEYPQFIGENHKPHVTKRDNEHFNAGDRKMVKAVCLVEIVDGKRVIHSRFTLAGYPR